MAHPLYHAKSSVKTFGGRVEDYIDLHNFFDSSKAVEPSFRHRALHHHTTGLNFYLELNGSVLTNADGCTVKTKTLIEQHLLEDFGIVPEITDWWKEDLPKHLQLISKSREDETRLVEQLFRIPLNESEKVIEVLNRYPQMFLQHSWGIFLLEKLLGIGSKLPTRYTTERILLLRYNNVIHRAQDYLSYVRKESWMYQKALKLSENL